MHSCIRLTDKLSLVVLDVWCQGTFTVTHVYSMSDIIKEKNRVTEMLRIASQEFSVEDTLKQINLLKSDHKITTDDRDDVFYASLWISNVFTACGEYLKTDDSDSDDRHAMVRQFLLVYRTRFLNSKRCWTEWTETDENITSLLLFHQYIWTYCLPTWFVEGADLRCAFERRIIYLRMLTAFNGQLWE